MTSPAVHRIDIEPATRRHSNGLSTDHNAVHMTHAGRYLGKSEASLYEAARALLADGTAADGDIIETWRGDILSMRGIAGELAKRDIADSPSTGLRRIKWNPNRFSFAGGNP